MRKLWMSAFVVILLIAVPGFTQGQKDGDATVPLGASKLKPVVGEGMIESFRPLYSLSIDEKNPGGKDMKLTVKELRRYPKTSLVEYSFVSGSSVGSSMTAMFAVYRIALDREAKYFVILQKRKGDSEFLVGFAAKEEPDPVNYFGVEGPLDKGLRWQSVEALRRR